MIKSNKIYSPQTYCEAITGRYYYFEQDNTKFEIDSILTNHFRIKMRHFELSNIEEVIKNSVDVILVDTSGFNGNNEWEYEYTWYEVPKDFKEEEK